MNLNRALDLNPSNLFYSNQIVSNNNVVVVTANQFTYEKTDQTQMWAKH